MANSLPTTAVNGLVTFPQSTPMDPQSTPMDYWVKLYGDKSTPQEKMTAIREFIKIYRVGDIEGTLDASEMPLRIGICGDVEAGW
jgi:hypothetical protein